jgi:hypothetical protein
MTLTKTLEEYIAAAFSGIWVQSHEHEDALADIGRMCAAHEWTLATWDIDRGLMLNGQVGENTNDPVAAIRSLDAISPEGDGASLLVLPNFHKFLNGAEIIQALSNQIHRGKNARTFVVVLSPVVTIPLELEKQFVVVDHELPDRTQLREVINGVATEAGDMPDDDDAVETIIDAASGLTRIEAESAVSLSLVRNGSVQPESIWEIKTQMLKKSGLLTLHRGSEAFDDLGGLDSIKTFCKRALEPRSSDVRARGILMLGVPGTGKSAFAKALGNETGRPLLHLDIGALMGSLVGQTEDNVRRALAIVDSMEPCIVFVDEIEKALSGSASSGQTDSGVSARLFGSLLTWLSDHTTNVFFVGTCNDISKLPPEFSRAERFDGVFFLDLPNEGERDAIWDLYIRSFRIDDKQSRPDDTNWTGAEIRSCCRLAKLLDVPLTTAADHVVPVATTSSESVQSLREWASGRCLSSSQPGIYRSRAAAKKTSGRKVARRSA